MFCFSYAAVWVWLKSKGGAEKINLYTDPAKKEVGVDWKDLRGRKEGNYKRSAEWCGADESHLCSFEWPIALLSVLSLSVLSCF